MPGEYPVPKYSVLVLSKFDMYIPSTEAFVRLAAADQIHDKEVVDLVDNASVMFPV